MSDADRTPGPLQGIGGIIKGIWTIFLEGFKPKVTRQVPETDGITM